MKNAKVQLDGAALKVLPALVSGTTAVALGCREAHWNVKGPNFGPLHELFGDLYDFFNDWADTLAERVVQQGGVASALEGWQGGGPIIGDEQALLSQVSAMSNVMAEMIHESIPLMGNDETSKDALTEYGRDLEKWVWKLESHLQQFQRVEDGPEQFSDVVDRVTARHDRRFTVSVGAELPETARRHQPVAQAGGSLGCLDRAALADEGVDRLGGAAITQ